MKKLHFAIALILLIPALAFAEYSLPSDDEDCPGNCRDIAWLAGSDQWNSGILPVYAAVACTEGLTEGDGTTDNASAIQTCINNLSTDEAAVLPAGIYYVNGDIDLKDNAVLRGTGTIDTFLPTADATVTTLKLGNSGNVIFSDNSPTKGAEIALDATAIKGATVIVTAEAHNLSEDDWLVIFQDEDTNGTYGLITDDNGNNYCSWCGESENNHHVISQFNQVVSVDSSTQVTLLRPLYYDYRSELNAGIKKVTWSRSYAGLENMRINGWGSSNTTAIVTMVGTLYSWVKDVEIYNDYNTAKAWHIYCTHSHGNEFRDSYIHEQRATSSDRAYGIGFMFTTSDNKIENNVIREIRHGTAQEGGGAGNVWLYNYIDDIYYRYDTTIKENPEMSHGAHPIFTLWEGNISTGFHAEYLFGTSSHGVLFRNHFWGDLSGNYPDYGASNPDYHFIAVLLDRFANYYSLVGNVLGVTGMHTTWSNATIHPTDCNFFYSSPRGTPTVYGFGCDENVSTFNSNSWDTSIKHGNYDYKTEGVAHWDGGADHDIADSVYYNNKPSWFGSVTWPPVDPTTPSVADIPAKVFYETGSWPDATPSAAITGTATVGINESDIVTGSKTIIITLSNDTWVATAGDDGAITEAIIADMDSNRGDAAGWDAVVKLELTHAAFTREADNVTMTIVLPDFDGDPNTAFDISQTEETITITIPATAVASATEIVATPTFSIGVEAAGGSSTTGRVGTYSSTGQTGTYSSTGIAVTP